MLHANPRLLTLAGALLFGTYAQLAPAQEAPDGRIEQIQQQVKIQRIAQERPAQAEYLARDFLRRVALADEIESVEVIKGSAAVATYGPRAANGVISITTKKGRALVRRVTQGQTVRPPVSAPPLYVIDGMVVDLPELPPANAPGYSFQLGPAGSPANALAELYLVGPNGGVFTPFPDSILAPLAYLDSLKNTALNEYWQEIGQVTVQAEMAREVARRDTARGRAMERMFGIEFDARGLQRNYRAVDDSKRPGIRSQLEQLMSRHFDIQTQLMQLEIADASRRLSAVSAELSKRTSNRAEQVRATVEGILRDPTRP